MQEADISVSEAFQAAADTLPDRDYARVEEVMDRIVSNPEAAAARHRYVSTRKVWGVAVPGTSLYLFWSGERRLADEGFDGIRFELLLPDQGI